MERVSAEICKEVELSFGDNNNKETNDYAQKALYACLETAQINKLHDNKTQFRDCLYMYRCFQVSLKSQNKKQTHQEDSGYP